MNLNKQTIQKILLVATGLLLISIVGAIATSYNYFKTEEVFEEKVVSQSFANVNIDSKNYKVAILPTKKSQARVTLTGKLLTKKQTVPTVTTNVKNGTLFVKIEKDKAFKLINFGEDIGFSLWLKVYLPQKSYDAITAKANNGAIKVSKLTTDTLTAKADNGKITLNNLKTGQLKANANNGKITFDDVTSKKSTFSIKNGGIKGNYLSGELNANASNGTIDIRLSKITDNINMKSNNGKVKLKFDTKPKQTSFITTANNGKIDIPNSFQSLNGSIYTVILTSNNGRIIVE